MQCLVAVVPLGRRILRDAGKNCRLRKLLVSHSTLSAAVSLYKNFATVNFEPSIFSAYHLNAALPNQKLLSTLQNPAGSGFRHGHIQDVLPQISFLPYLRHRPACIERAPNVAFYIRVVRRELHQERSQQSGTSWSFPYQCLLVLHGCMGRIQLQGFQVGTHICQLSQQIFVRTVCGQMFYLQKACLGQTSLQASDDVWRAFSDRRL